MDDLELSDDVQSAVKEVWNKVTTDNIHELTDINGYKKEFLKLFGFEVDGINYDEDVEI